MGPAELAILKTVVYADLFDYPLRFDELCAGLFDLRLEPDHARALLDLSPALSAALDERGGFVFLRGRDHLVEKRREGERRASALLARHRRALALVARLPYVRLLALSGAAAFGAVHDDDVDVFIVCGRGRAWSACMLVTLASRALGVRRTICANYILEETALALGERDFYTAHQLLSLAPLSGGDTHRAFVAANPWAEALFPAAYARALDKPAPPARRGLAERLLALGPGALLEALSRRALSGRLRRKVPAGGDPDSVRLGPDRLKLHTNDHRSRTIARFERALAAATEAASAEALAGAGSRVAR
jgi:hypothetical protein